MLKFRRDVLAGLGHRIDAVLLLEQRIDEAPADGRVEHLHVACERGVAPFDMTYGARLMLSTPPAITTSASPVRIMRAALATASRPEPHSRLSVAPGTSTRKAGEQRTHPRDIAIVLARLIGAAQNHIVDGARIEPRIAPQQLAQHHGREIVGPH